MHGAERLLEDHLVDGADHLPRPHLTQISATQRALQGVGLALLTDYLRHAHATGTLTDDTVLDAASTAITQLIRS